MKNILGILACFYCVNHGLSTQGRIGIRVPPKAQGQRVKVKPPTAAAPLAVGGPALVFTECYGGKERRPCGLLFYGFNLL